MYRLLSESSWHWKSIDDKVTLIVKLDNIRRDLIGQYDLCLTGEVIKENYGKIIKLRIWWVKGR